MLQYFIGRKTNASQTPKGFLQKRGAIAPSPVKLNDDDFMVAKRLF